MNKKLIISIIVTLILILSFAIPVFAVNTTNVNSSTTTTSQSKKSNNANLSNLGIKPNDFTGFKESRTQYNTTVPNSTSEVEVYATKKDFKATVTGTGRVKLQEGDNTVKVVVTAEDGITTKTYTINIKRLKTGEQVSTSDDDSDLGLEKIEIAGKSIEPQFNKDVHQYKVSFEGEETKLDISAQANQSGATVQIIGNEKLINGQNLITILVSNSKQSKVVTYQIYVNKNLVEQEELNGHFNDGQTQQKIKKWIIISLVFTIIICIILLFVILSKRRKNIKYKVPKQQETKTKNYNNKQKDKKQKDKKHGKHSK